MAVGSWMEEKGCISALTGRGATAGAQRGCQMLERTLGREIFERPNLRKCFNQGSHLIRHAIIQPRDTEPQETELHKPHSLRISSDLKKTPRKALHKPEASGTGSSESSCHNRGVRRDCQKMQAPLLKQREALREDKEDFHPDLERILGARVQFNETEQLKSLRNST